MIEVSDQLLARLNGQILNFISVLQVATLPDHRHQLNMVPEVGGEARSIRKTGRSHRRIRAT